MKVTVENGLRIVRGGFDDVASEAIFSEDGAFRYSLAYSFFTARINRVVACFVMLNPSKAGQSLGSLKVADDMTAKKVRQFARRWGCGKVYLVNLFALIATKPFALATVADPIGPLNDRYVHRALGAAQGSGGPVVCAWGEDGGFRDQDVRLLEQLQGLQIAPQCLGTTALGFPRHPSRIAYATPLQPFRGRRQST